MKYIIFTIILGLTFFNIKAQNAQLHITGGNVNITNNGSTVIVLNNTKFINDGSFDAGNSEVEISGNALSTNSSIGGSTNLSFYKLKINKATNNAKLNQDITVSHNLTLLSGKLELTNYNLSIGNNGTIAGQNKDRYIKTNGTGFLIRQVGTSWTSFPIGKTTFNPARLKNDGTIDNFKIRIEDHFLQNGTSGNAITANVIPKTWFIEEETVGGSDVSMQLIWRPVHIGSGFNTNASHITHYTGGNWQDQTTGTSTADNSYSSDHRYREATNITSFSPFGVKSGASLPVELLYFYAEKEGKNVRLDWQTATELNNSHFEIEWSTNGIEFTKIGQVQGAGTTNDITFYDFLHTSPAQGLNYYRLKQVDFDEKYEYTDILSVNYELGIKNYELNIFPNPAANFITIDGMQEGKIIQIFNVNGQLVKTFYQNVSTQQTDISDLSSGTYFVKMKSQVKKLIIQK